MAAAHCRSAGAQHLETNTGLDNRKLLMWLFLASDCLFFGSFIAAYLLYRDRSVSGRTRRTCSTSRSRRSARSSC